MLEPEVELALNRWKEVLDQRRPPELDLGLPWKAIMDAVDPFENHKVEIEKRQEVIHETILLDMVAMVSRPFKSRSPVGAHKHRKG